MGLPIRAMALDGQARDVFFIKVSSYLFGLRQGFSSLVTAQPEDQLKAPVGDLVVGAASLFGLTAFYRTETRVDGVAGRPDIGFDIDGLPAGNLELKAPGSGSTPARFRDKRSRDQWERFRALPNLMYTDGRYWSLFRYGEQVGELVDLGVDVDSGTAQPHHAEVTSLLDLIAEFLDWEPLVPSEPKALAQMLAPVARLLRDEVLDNMKQGGVLNHLAKEWRATLFPDAGEKQFADGYAQTYTYALLLARLEGAPAPLDSHAAAAELDSDHALLAQTLRVIGQSEVRDAISLPVSLLERLIGAVDGDKLARKGDPWLYFYEDFLAAYDPEQRNNRGVYYTPIQVVQFQVRVVDSVLRNSLKIVDGFAANQVTVLDPAAGTGTYPLAIIQRVLEQTENNSGVGLLPEVATQLARNINAFELLVGAYAVSHLRISRTLADAGASLPSAGVNVFLTDSLSPGALPGLANQVTLFERKLAEEQERASHVKSVDTRITAVIGNPPWDRDTTGWAGSGRKKGGMVRYDTNGEVGLIADFLSPLSAKARSEHSVQLYNDYVYFWRWAMWKALEQNEGPAVVSFITASSYLTGPAFAGMREKMRRQFDEIWLVDLGGEGRGTVREDNVFAGVLTPNVIAVGVRSGHSSTETVAATVRYVRVQGRREAKLVALTDIELDATVGGWEVASEEWGASFLPKADDEYADAIPLAEIFPWSTRGMQFSRSWPVAETESLAEQRWRALLSADHESQVELLHESRDSQVSRAARSFLTGAQLPAIAETTADTEPDAICRIAFRSFDVHWAVADARVIDMPRSSLWNTVSSEQIFLTSIDGQSGVGPAVIAHPYVPDLNATNNRGGLVYPLFKDRDRQIANVSAVLLRRLSQDFAREVGADEVVDYVLGLAGTGALSVRFGSAFKNNGIRVPMTSESSLFERGVELGRRVLSSHTHGERGSALPPSARPFSAARVVRAIQGPNDMYPNSFSYEASSERLFVGAGVVEGVSSEVWEFEVSGYRPLQAWLAYRMHDRSGKTSSRLDAIRPARWELTSELLRLIASLEALVIMETEALALLDAVLLGGIVRAGDLPPVPDQERAGARSVKLGDSDTIF